MDFNATSLNITELLVAALAIVAVIFLFRKRYDSNLPLLFYTFLIMFTSMSDRSVHPFLLYGGLASALVLRFEFMGSGFSKFIAFLATGTLVVIIYSMMVDVFST